MDAMLFVVIKKGAQCSSLDAMLFVALRCHGALLLDASCGCPKETPKMHGARRFLTHLCKATEAGDDPQAIVFR